MLPATYHYQVTITGVSQNRQRYPIYSYTKTSKVTYLPIKSFLVFFLLCVMDIVDIYLTALWERLKSNYSGVVHQIFPRHKMTESNVLTRSYISSMAERKWCNDVCSTYMNHLGELYAHSFYLKKPGKKR